jgi:hypothetical protein
MRIEATVARADSVVRRSPMAGRNWRFVDETPDPEEGRDPDWEFFDTPPDSDPRGPDWRLYGESGREDLFEEPIRIINEDAVRGFSIPQEEPIRIINEDPVRGYSIPQEEPIRIINEDPLRGYS